MKILTILIFSGDRTSVKGLLKDIVKINQKNLNIRLIDWGENKKIIKKKKKIYSHFKKKIKNLKIYYQKGNWEFKYPIFINKFSSKYILIMGDDDRIIINLTEGVKGFLPKKDFDNSSQQTLIDVGTEIEVVIANINKKDREIILSLRALEKAEERDALRDNAEKNKEIEESSKSNLGDLIRTEIEEKED